MTRRLFVCVVVVLALVFCSGSSVSFPADVRDGATARRRQQRELVGGGLLRTVPVTRSCQLEIVCVGFPCSSSTINLKPTRIVSISQETNTSLSKPLVLSTPFFCRFLFLDRPRTISTRSYRENLARAPSTIDPFPAALAFVSQ